MRRTTTFTILTVLGLALTAPLTASAITASDMTTSAMTAGPSCRGEAATIVGTDEARLMGTAGADVIVSGLADEVVAGAGNDLVCISARDDGSSVRVNAGAGDDVVISEGEKNYTDTDLGPGRDEFVGGGQEDWVEASLDDTVLADRGGDLVTYRLGRGEPLPAVVGALTGDIEDGWIEVVAPGRRVVIDGSSGVVKVDGTLVTTLVTVPQMLYGVAQHVRLTGTPGRDRLATAACASSVLRGGGGDDELLPLGDRATPKRQCPRRRMTALGGRGNDRLFGTNSDDVLRGGPGRDLLMGRRGVDFADGGKGRDTCNAERERRCER